MPLSERPLNPSVGSAAPAATLVRRLYQDGRTVHIDDLGRPDEFDALLTDPALSLSLLAEPPATELGRLRRVQILFAHDALASLEDLEAELDQVRDVPTRGTLFQLRLEARLYEEVAGADADPTGASPLELEDACRAHAMVGMACRFLNRPHLALEHLRSAITLAKAIGTKSRLTTLQLMWHQARAQIEEPDLDGLEVLLMQPHLSERSRHWGQRMKAQSLQELGALDDALRALGPFSQDTSADAGHREYLHALLNLPPARPSDDHLLSCDDPYVRLAQAVRDSQINKRVDLRDVRGHPYESYARLIEARSLLPVKRMEGAVLSILGDTPPKGPGQAAVWAIYRMTAGLKDGREDVILDASRVLRAAMPRLRTIKVVEVLLDQLSPELKLALMMGPLSGMMNGLSQMTLLTGQVIVQGAESVRLTGRIGRALVLQGAKHPDAPELARAEKSRFRKALLGFQAENAINVGASLRYCLAFYRAARNLDDVQAAALWHQAYMRLHGMLNDDVQYLFAEDPAASLL